MLTELIEDMNVTAAGAHQYRTATSKPSLPRVFRRSARPRAAAVSNRDYRTGTSWGRVEPMFCGNRRLRQRHPSIRVRAIDQRAARTVLIEIWKAKAPTVLEYFRRCLGQQIGSPGNILTHPSGRTEAVPIVTIYFLGYDLGLSDEPVIDVCTGVTERRTGRELEARHPLLEGIHNRSHIIQIPRLASRRRDELERVLAIFDQGPAYGNGWRSPHMLTIAEEEYPAECGFVLRQLREAIAEEEVRRTIEGEDVLFRDSILLAHQVAYHQRRAEQGQQRAEQRRQQTRALSAGGPSPYGKSVRMPAPATTDAVALRGSTAALRSERAGDACFRVRRRCIRRRSSAREDPIRIASVRVRVLNGWVDGRSAMVGLPRLVDGWRAGFRRFRRPPFQ